MPNHLREQFLEGLVMPRGKTSFQLLAEKMVTDLAKLPKSDRAAALEYMRQRVKADA